MLPGGINMVLRRYFAKISSQDIDGVEVSPAVAFTDGMCIMAVFSVIFLRSQRCFSTVLCIFSCDVFITSNESFNVSYVLVAMSS